MSGITRWDMREQKHNETAWGFYGQVTPMANRFVLDNSNIKFFTHVPGCAWDTMWVHPHSICVFLGSFGSLLTASLNTKGPYSGL